jgi:S-DNA-T family DNA segregation ATPase FtsK/SpoIIIE
MREAAGTLSGYCLGEDVEQPLTPQASILDDLRVVFATIETDKAWSETVIEALVELRPGRYDGLTPTALTALLRPYGITTGQVWQTLSEGGGANRRDSPGRAVTAAVDRAAGRPPGGT